MALADRKDFSAASSASAPPKHRMAPSSSGNAAACSTFCRITGAISSSATDCPAVAAARATHRKITLLRVCHASRSIKAVFCHRLYRGLDVVSIRISLHGYPTTKKSPAVCRGMNGAPGGTKRTHSAGSSISVVKAPSSEFRLMYPPRRSTMASMRTSPRPWPAPLVLRKSFPTLGSFFPAVKLVMEI